MEDQEKYLNQATSRGMTADQWHDFFTDFSRKFPAVLGVLVSEKMKQRVHAIADNIEGATDAVMAAVNESAAILNEAVAELLDAAYGETIPTVSARGMDSRHDAILAEVKDALTIPNYQTRFLVAAMRPLKDEEGFLFGEGD